MRPEAGSGPWLLYAPNGVFALIDLPAELQQAMEGDGGYFHATLQHDQDAWDIGERAPDQSW